MSTQATPSSKPAQPNLFTFFAKKGNENNYSTPAQNMDPVAIKNDAFLNGSENNPINVFQKPPRPEAAPASCATNETISQPINNDTPCAKKQDIERLIANIDTDGDTSIIIEVPDPADTVSPRNTGAEVEKEDCEALDNEAIDLTQDAEDKAPIVQNSSTASKKRGRPKKPATEKEEKIPKKGKKLKKKIPPESEEKTENPTKDFENPMKGSKPKKSIEKKDKTASTPGVNILQSLQAAASSTKKPKSETIEGVSDSPIEESPVEPPTEAVVVTQDNETGKITENMTLPSTDTDPSPTEVDAPAAEPQDDGNKTEFGDPAGEVPPSSKKTAVKSSQRTKAAKAKKAEKLKLSPEVEQRMGCVNERMKALTSELIALESCPEVSDEKLELEKVTQDLLGFHRTHLSATEEPKEGPLDASTTAVDLNSSEEVSPVPNTLVPVPLDDKETALVLVRTLVGRCVQGSATPLSTLVTSVVEELTEVFNAFSDAPCASANTGDDSLLGVGAKEVKSTVSRLLDPLQLDEEIKGLAIREAHGVRGKNVNMFEDADDQAVWRWELNSTTLLSKSALSTVREARTVRGRYGRALKAWSRVNEQLLKTPVDGDVAGNEVKVANLEEKAMKCLAEIEKAKERKAELEKKRVNDLQEKQRREELKEQKKREREEEALKKKIAQKSAHEKQLSAEAEAKLAHQEEKKRVAEEKAKKEAMLKEKQKNMFMSFLKVTPKAELKKEEVQEVQAKKEIVVDLDLLEKRLEHFEKSLQSGLSVEEIGRLNSKRYKEQRKVEKQRKKTEMLKRGKARRAYVRMSVTVDVKSPNANPFDSAANDYCEIQEKLIDNRLRTLSFCSDYRPAYVGTFSKRSGKISGRRPLTRDEEMFNYEYDSEAEWEEEEEGEDIGDNSGDEEEDGDNELQYDDFFCRDNDYGSDVDDRDEMDDNDGASAFCKESAAGPCFVHYPGKQNLMVGGSVVGSFPEVKRAERVSAYSVDYESAGTGLFRDFSNRQMLSKNNSEVVELSKYVAVVFLGNIQLPVLGEEVVAKDKESLNTNGEDEEKVKEGTPAVVKELDENMVKHLAMNIHGKKEGCDNLVESFVSTFPSVPKVRVKRKIKEIAERKRHQDGHGSMRWVVKDDFISLISSDNGTTEIDFTPPKKKKKRIAPTAVSSTPSLPSITTAFANTPVPSQPTIPSQPIVPQDSVIPLSTPIRSQPTVPTPIAVPTSNLNPSSSSTSFGKGAKGGQEKSGSVKGIAFESTVDLIVEKKVERVISSPQKVKKVLQSAEKSKKLTAFFPSSSSSDEKEGENNVSMVGDREKAQTDGEKVISLL